MVFPQLKKWAKLNDWHLYKNKVYGDYNGYIFTAFDKRGYKAFVTHLPNLTDQQKQNINHFLKQNKRKFKLSEYIFQNNILVFIFKETFTSFKVQHMKVFLDELTQFLASEGIIGKDICEECGMTGQFPYVIYDDYVVVQMCESCYKESIQNIEKLNQESNLENKNYTTGTIGAILGGLVAIIPWIVVGVFFNLMASILGYLIGWTSLKAYTLFKGKVGRATPWIIGINTFFCVVVAEILTTAIFLHQAYIPINMDNLIIAFTHPEIAAEIWKELGIGLFMAFLGISSIFKQMKQEINHNVPSLKKLSI